MRGFARWVVLGIALSACKRDAPKDVAPAAPSSSSEAALSATATPAAAASAAPASAPSAAAPKPLVQSKDRPRRIGAHGSTRETISYGTKRCQAGAEVCAWDNDAAAWACVAPSSPLAKGERYAC